MLTGDRVLYTTRCWPAHNVSALSALNIRQLPPNRHCNLCVVQSCNITRHPTSSITGYLNGRLARLSSRSSRARRHPLRHCGGWYVRRQHIPALSVGYFHAATNCIYYLHLTTYKRQWKRSVNVQELDYCWDGRAMLHSADCCCRVRVTSLLRSSENITINYTLSKTSFFGLHFCCRQYGSNFNHCDVSAPSKATEFGEIRQKKITAITPFKVIQSCQFRHQWKAGMRLPMCQ